MTYTKLRLPVARPRPRTCIVTGQLVSWRLYVGRSFTTVEFANVSTVGLPPIYTTGDSGCV